MRIVSDSGFLVCSLLQELNMEYGMSINSHYFINGAIPAKFVPSHAKIYMNLMFSNLNKWAHVERRCVELNLLQADRKPHHGFQQMGPFIREMMYVQVKVSSDLSNHLHCLDRAASVSNPNGYIDWSSLIVLSESNATNDLVTKHLDTLPGWCEKIYIYTVYCIQPNCR